MHLSLRYSVFCEEPLYFLREMEVEEMEMEADEEL